MRNMFLLTILLVLCTRTYCSESARDFVYVATQNGMVQGFAVGQDGQLKSLPFAPMQAGPPHVTTDIDSGLDIVVSPQKGLVYISTYRIVPVHDPDPQNNSGGVLPMGISTLRSYRVGSDGRLSVLVSVSVPAGNAIHALAFDPKGRFLYALAENGTVLIYRIGGRGSFTRLRSTHVLGTFYRELNPDGGLAVGPTDEAIFTVDPDGRYATLCHNIGFVDWHKYTIVRYRVGINGGLRTVETCREEEGGTNAISVTSDSRFIYLTGWRYRDKPSPPNLGYTDASGIQQYRVRSNGMLAPLQPLTIGKDENTTTIDPHARFLYTNAKADGISVFHIGKDGRLSLLSHSAPSGVPHGWLVSASLLTSSTQFLYAVIFTGDGGLQEKYSLAAYHISAKGHLKQASSLPIQAKPVHLFVMRR